LAGARSTERESWENAKKMKDSYRRGKRYREGRARRFRDVGRERDEEIFLQGLAGSYISEEGEKTQKREKEVQ